MERMTAAEFREMMDKPKSKYKAKRTTVDGITFDSKLEADFYSELKIRMRTGEIKGFTRQPSFLLQEAFEKDGKKYRKLEYVADFLVHYPGGKTEIVDCKGKRTRTYLDKRKLFEKRYPHLTIKEVT